jgi:GntR family histidine utilization transcriptional repressor
LEEQIAQDNTPIFQRIKDYLVGEIAAGRWKEGELVPSEQALVRQFGASRMTVNRAVRELSAEQVLIRRQGAGTFVAPRKYHATAAARACSRKPGPATRSPPSSGLAPAAPCSTP